MARCWLNPAARGCKTCVHFVTYGGEYGDHCDVGVDLTGRPACAGCGGHGWADISAGAQVPCGPERSINHIGDGAEVKPGPIVGCDRWEASADCNTNSICPARAECAAENACRITRERQADHHARPTTGETT
jgi:hypothetical protein